MHWLLEGLRDWFSGFVQLVVIALVLIVLGGGGYTLVHFITKYW